MGDVLNKYKELGSKDKFLEWLDFSGIINSEYKWDCYRFINDLVNWYVMLNWGIIDIDK